MARNGPRDMDDPTPIIETVPLMSPVDTAEHVGEPDPGAIAVRGVVTVRMMADGNYQVEMAGVSQLEVPSLLRVAARRVEHELGIG